MQAKIGALILGLSLAGCSSLQQLSSQGRSNYKNPELANLNPAPASVSPPAEISENNLDPVYLRSQADYHYTMGESQSLVGNSERAIEEFKHTLIYDANAYTVRLRLAAEYVKLGAMSEALEQAELSVQGNPTFTSGRLLLAGIYATLKINDAAEREYLKVIELDPSSSEAPLYLSAIYAEEGRFEDALKLLSSLAKNDKNKNPHIAHYYAGRVYIELGGSNSLEKAAEAFQKSLLKKADYEEAVLALASVYELQKNSEKSVRLLQRFQERSGPTLKIASRLVDEFLKANDFTNAYTQLDIWEGFEPDNLNVKVKMALILIETKKFEPAIEKLEEILRIAPGSDKIRFYLGAVYEEVKNFKLAIENFSKISAGSTYFVEAVMHQAYLHKLEGRSKKAMEILESAIAARDNVPQFYTFYSSLLDEAKNPRKAITILSQAAEKFPDNTQVHFYLGSMFDKIGDIEKTLVHMQRVLELDDSHVQALNYVAYTFADQNRNLDEAEKLVRKALKASPGDGYILDTLGWVYFRQGKLNDSIRTLEIAHKAKPEEAIIAEHLGDAYSKAELVEKALAMYQKAIALEKNDLRLPNIKVKMAEIENLFRGNTRMPASLSPAPTQ